MTLPRSAFNSNREFNNYIRSLPTDGSAGDINQISASYLGMPAQQQAPTRPSAPKTLKAPVQAKATQASVGQGVRRARKSSRKTRLSDLRIKRPKINTALAIGAGGTGLNVGGY